MHPFPGHGGLTREQRVFNYRASRALLVVEDAFGSWSGQWRMFPRELDISVGQGCPNLFHRTGVNDNSAYNLSKLLR